MRIRRANIAEIFAQEPLQKVIVSLSKPNLSYLVKCLDFKIHQITKIQNISQNLKKCRIQTDFGEIELCLEIINNNQHQIQHRLKWYNLQGAEELWAATYQQTLIYNQNDLILSLTFRQITRHVRSIKVDKALIELPKAFYYMNENGFDIASPLDHVVESEITGKYYLDYFHLDQLKRSPGEVAKSFLKDLAELPQNDQYLKATVYLLEDQAYSWRIKQEDIVELSQVEIMDWFLLSILMNLEFLESKVVSFWYQDTPHIIKKGSIQQFGGKIVLSLYPTFPLTFRSGKCIDQYTSLTQQSLKNNYFQLLKTYRVVKKNVLSVIKQPNTFNPNQSIIIIDQLVSKIDCVEFFIIYMKYFELSIETIVFKRQNNQLLLTLRQGKYIVIKFHKDYAVKQQEISIIVNKSNLINCTIDLQNSRVSDKLLILLSNIDTASNIKTLNLDRCKELTEFGLNTLFQSPNMRNIIDLNLSDTAVTEETIDLIKSNLLHLQKLTINNCQLVSQQLNFKQIPSLEKLSAIGTWIDPIFSSKLKVLRLSIEFPIEQLKHLSRMPLEVLKVKLVQNRKQQIVNFMNNLYSSSSHYTKQLMEGPITKTLKVLDIAQSTVKYKLIKSLFSIKSLNEICLSKCSNLGDEFDYVNKQIETMTLEETSLSVRNIKTLLNRCGFLRSLNIRGTLSKRETVELIQLLGKNINQLFIDESQYSQSLLKYLNKGGASSINKLSIKVTKITLKTQRMIQQLSVNLQKLINIQCDEQEQIIQKIYSIMGRKEKQKNHLRLKYQQLSVVEKRIESRRCKSDSLQLGSCRDTTLFVHKIIQHTKSESMIKVNLRNNRYLSSPIIDFITVFAKSHIKSIDIRNCLFGFQEVEDKIMNWEKVEEVNDGEFHISFDKKNFTVKAQKYLKFFMKIHNLKSLSVDAKRVGDVPFMFSILHYVINHHKLTLQTFQLHLVDMDLQLKDEITEFWEALLTTITLKNFSFSFESDKQLESLHFEKIKSLNYLNLHKLKLSLPQQPKFYPKIQGLKQLSLNLKEQVYVNDTYLADLIKPLDSLEVLELDISKTSLHSVEKFSSVLKTLKRLQQLDLNFQYCTIKTSHCISILPNLKDAKQIRKVVMNVSFTLEGMESLGAELISHSDQLNHPLMEIIALRVTNNYTHLAKQLQLRYITLLV